MESKIKWQTGKPKEKGTYIVTYEGWASPWCDEHRVIDLTIELHSKFPYLDYYDEPLWVDMFDPRNFKSRIQIMKKILCWFGIHNWKYVLDNKIFPFTSYKYCKRCHKIKLV